jgi:4-diphosphocytidyl-2-C-methyl-D-erythritol kinase
LLFCLVIRDGWAACCNGSPLQWTGMPTRVRSHAKINLGLAIGSPRLDGFHSLATVYQTLEIHDVVTVQARPSGQTAIRLTSNDERVPTDSRNTAWKMVDLALQDAGTHADVAIHIDKRLPIQGGLGAGSANAVAALVGLELELEQFRPPAAVRFDVRQIAENTKFSDSAHWPGRHIKLAAQVGSDVPLFLVGGTILGRDRGQDVLPLADLDPTWCLIAAPGIGVSTPKAFHDWDTLCVAEGLTGEASEDRLEKLSQAYARAFSGGQGSGSSGVLSRGEDLAGPQESVLVRTGITSWMENDFERVVFPQHPILCEIKRILAGTNTPEDGRPYSSLLASLSGSGSALYGLYRNRGDAEAAQSRLTKQIGKIKVRSMLTRTLPRPAYWAEMIL